MTVHVVAIVAGWLAGGRGGHSVEMERRDYGGMESGEWRVESGVG